MATLFQDAQLQYIRLELKNFLLSSEFMEDCAKQHVYPSESDNCLISLFSLDF